MCKRCADTTVNDVLNRTPLRVAPIGRCRVPLTRLIVSALRAPPIKRVRADYDSQP
jgi:hypothetical protein